MGDNFEGTSTANEATQLVGQKSKSHGKPSVKEIRAKKKRGSVLSAVEDIQRMSNEAISKEFDRLVDSTERHFENRAEMPCASVATQLLRCQHQNKQKSYKCFGIMGEYRKCVTLATQEHVDRLIENEERVKNMPMPIVPPRPMVAAAAHDEEEEEEPAHQRSWYKPWSWSWTR